jgi:hypothetical protein
MLTQKQIMELDPPEGLNAEELRNWYLERLCEPDGSFIINDRWDDEDPKPEPPTPPPSGETIQPK